MTFEDIRISELIKPTERQLDCIRATDNHRYVLYGGGAGGGKSYLLRWWLIRQLIRRFKETGIERLKVGLFSADYPTLQQRQIGPMEREFPAWLGQIKRTEKEGLCFYIQPEFGAGRIALLNLEDPASYKSAEFCDIAVEELSENKRDVFEDLALFRLRWPGITRPSFLAATNPTGIGMQWIKALWVDRKFPKELDHLKDEFCYVPALLGDNPHLGKDYQDLLRGLPEKKRKALLEGDWTVPEGQYYTNFERSERKVHPSVIAQIVKPWWPKWIGQDWGFKHHSPVHWHTVGSVMPEEAKLLGRGWSTPRRCVFTYRELITQMAEEDSSERELGSKIVKLSGDEPIKKWILSADAFGKKTTQKTPAELLKEGAGRSFCSPQQADMSPGSRVPGWRFLYQLIQDDAWFISEMCPAALDAIPALEYDSEKGGEDILKTDDISDDVGDELRYSLVDMLNTKAEPWQHKLETAVQQAFNEGGGTRAHMVHLQMLDKHKPKKKFGRQYV